VTVQTRYECGLRASFVLKGQNIDCGQRKKTVRQLFWKHLTHMAITLCLSPILMSRKWFLKPCSFDCFPVVLPKCLAQAAELA